MKKAIMKGVALATLVASAVALTQALKKNRKSKVLKEAAMDAKENVLAHARKLGKVSKDSYGKVVDAVMAEYAAMKTLSKKELSELRDELKEGWEGAKDRITREKKNGRKS